MEIRHRLTFFSPWAIRLLAIIFIIKISRGLAFAMTLSLLAQGAGPVYSSDPPPGTTINIGVVELGQYSTKRNIIISNTGTSRLSISSIQNSNTGDFDVSDDQGFNLLAGGQKNVMITCHPSRSGLRTGTMRVFHDAPNSPATYQLTCYGGSSNIPIYDSDPKPGSTIDLGEAVVESATPARILKVTNIGNGTLDVTGALIRGSNSADFKVTGYPLSLGSNLSGHLSITCIPGDIGERTATLEVNHTGLDSPASYTLTCTGLPKITGPGYGSDPAPSSAIDIGTINITSRITKTIEVVETGDAELTISLINLSGSNSGDFDVAPSNFNIGDGGNPVNVTIGCTPSAEGLRVAVLAVYHNAPNSPAVYQLTCTGIQPPKAPGYDSNPAPGSTINIGETNVSNRITSTLAVSETGNATLVISSMTLGGANPGDFDFSPNSFSIDDGGNPVTVIIGCTPSVEADRIATLTVNHNASNTPSIYNLTCKGIPPPLVPVYSSDPAQGGTVDLGQSFLGTVTPEKVLKITNTGNGTLKIIDTVVSGANSEDFKVTGAPFYLGANESNQLTIICTPNDVGTRSATLIVSHNATGSSASYTLTCNGIVPPKVPGYTSEPLPGSSIDFGQITINQRTIKTIDVRETGNTTLVISSITLGGANPGDFDVSPTNFSIDSGGNSVTLTIGCTPSVEGNRTSTLVVNHNAADSPAKYTLSCTGIYSGGRITIKTTSAAWMDLDNVFAPDQIITSTLSSADSTFRGFALTAINDELGIIVQAQQKLASGTYIADGIVASGDILPYSFGGNSLLATKALPMNLGGATIMVTDSSGSQFLAGMYSVSPTEINWLMPSGVIDGPAKITFNIPGYESIDQQVTIARTAPGIFTANATGSGVPVAMLFRLKRDGSEIFEKIAEKNVQGQTYEPIPIDLGAKTDQILLSLCGTGFRHHPSETNVTATIGGTTVDIYYSGELPENPGIDQINLVIKRSLIGKGGIPVNIAFGSSVINTVNIHIK